MSGMPHGMHKARHAPTSNTRIVTVKVEHCEPVDGSQRPTMKFRAESMEFQPQGRPRVTIKTEPLDHQPGPSQPHQPQMRPVTLVAPRGLLPVPPGMVQQTSADDHKFKKPMLPQRHRRITEEEKRRRDVEDARRVQMHLMEAKKASQEAAAANMSNRTRPIPNRTMVKPLPPPPPPEASLTPEIKQAAESEYQKVILNGESMELPNLLLFSNVVLHYVASKTSFNSLSEESKTHLKKFLPKAETPAEEEAVLDCAFSRKKNLVKGNPLDILHARFKAGWYNNDRMHEVMQIRDTEKIMYDHYIRMYHMKLFKKLIISRHMVLSQHDQANVQDAKRPGPQPRNKDTVKEKNLIWQLKKRAAKRSRMLVTECRQKAGDQGISSDDEEDDVGAPICKALQTNNYMRSTIFNPRIKDLDLHQPLQCDDIKTMLKKYKKLKRTDPRAPSLMTKGIRLEEVFDRAGVLAQSEKIKQTVDQLEKDLQRQKDDYSMRLFK